MLKEKDKKKGQMLVEAVISLPIILVILFSTLDFARYFVRQIEMNFLAYNTARIMMVHSPDTSIVSQHLDEYHTLYRNVTKNSVRKEIQQDDTSGVYFLAIEHDVSKSVALVPWDSFLVSRAVAPFQMGDSNPRDIPYEWKGQTTHDGEPAIKGFDNDFRNGMAKVEGVVKSTSGTGLSSFLMKQWYPEKVNVGGVSFLEAAKLNLLGIFWWYAYLDRDTRRAIDAYMMFGYTPVGRGEDEWLSRKYTGFMHGKDRIGYWGVGTSPPPPIDWDRFGPSCSTGWGGQYYANSWTPDMGGALSKDDGAFYWAQSHEICTHPVYGWHHHCIWCAKSEFTPVRHYVYAHAGGGMWSNKRNYWNFYNAVWALALLPESYATATYYSDYWNIKDDWYHFSWEDRVPDYRPDQVRGMSMNAFGMGSQSGMAHYAELIPQSDPKDEQHNWMGEGSDEQR